MNTIVLKNVPESVWDRVRARSEKAGVTMEDAALELLSHGASGVRIDRKNAIEELGGTWTEEQYQEFCEATRSFEQIDEALWN